MHRKMDYIDHEGKTIQIDIYSRDGYKIPEQSINKALMIAMNYLIENIETDKHESAD